MLAENAQRPAKSSERDIKNIKEFSVVPQEGLEPPTPSLRMTCSTN
jgi:hypothetical protein